MREQIKIGSPLQQKRPVKPDHEKKSASNFFKADFIDRHYIESVYKCHLVHKVGSRIGTNKHDLSWLRTVFDCLLQSAYFVYQMTFIDRLYSDKYTHTNYKERPNFSISLQQFFQSPYFANWIQCPIFSSPHP